MDRILPNNVFYELQTEDAFHLREYHEYYFWTHNRHRWNEIQRLEQYEHFDIRLVPFPESEKLPEDCGSPHYRIPYPERLYFTGNFETLLGTDFPIVDRYQLPVFSKKFVKVLESARPFRYNSIPVTIFDFLAEDPFAAGNELRPEVTQTDEYVYLKLLQFVMMDKGERYNYKARYLDAFTIAEPEEALDPVFRVRQLNGRLFIAGAARQAIDDYNATAENKIKGIRLYDFYDYQYYY